jgi:hypothetical protein
MISANEFSLMAGHMGEVGYMIEDYWALLHPRHRNGAPHTVELCPTVSPGLVRECPCRKCRAFDRAWGFWAGEIGPLIGAWDIARYRCDLRPTAAKLAMIRAAYHGLILRHQDREIRRLLG